MNEPQTNGIAPGEALNATPVRRRRAKKKTRQKRSAAVKAKPNLPPLNELAAAQEACRHAQEGNIKLARTIDFLREGLQTISIAEWDRVAGREVLASELRSMARETLSGAGFSKPVVRTRAGKADGDLSKNRNLDGVDYD